MNYTEKDIGVIMKQILNGVMFCHQNDILHRDLKPQNILITSAGLVKLADFGLACTSSDKKYYTDNCMTLWYKPPELLNGSPTKYGPEVDMWSIGCIMAELFQRAPLFPGKDKQHQYKLISEMCRAYDCVTVGLDVQLGTVLGYRTTSNLYVDFSEDLLPEELELLLGLLAMDPTERLLTGDALSNPWIMGIDMKTAFPLYLGNLNKLNEIMPGEDMTESPKAAWVSLEV